MVWEPDPCATVYNVYRLVARRMADADGDGVADDYGSCFKPDLGAPQMTDPSVPSPGFVAYIQVTGEGSGGEGSLGNASNGRTRTNSAPCPWKVA